jgi:hypothetical protein
VLSLKNESEGEDLIEVSDRTWLGSSLITLYLWIASEEKGVIILGG